MQSWVAEMYALGRSLDPTRPIIENSACEADHTVAEVNDIHLFPTGYGDLAAQARHELDAWVAGAYPGSGHNFAPGYRQDDQPLLVSSIAGWASVEGVETSFPLRTLVNAVRSRERIAGYGWVQLYDVEWELTGILTYERGAKAFGYDIVDVNADDVLVVDGPLAGSAVLGEPIILNLSLAHASGRIAGPVHVGAWLDGLSASWQRVRTDVEVMDAAAIVERRGVIVLGTLRVPSPGEPVAGRLVVEAYDDSAQAVARTHVNVGWLASEPAEQPAALLQMPLECWSASTGSTLESLHVGDAPQRIISPSLIYKVRLPDSAALGQNQEVHLLAEAAVVGLSTAGQSPEEVEVVPVQILLDGAVAAETALPRLRADSRGTLSIIHPEGLGTYGDRLAVPIALLGDLASGEHIVEIKPSDPGSDRRIVVFGPLLGQAPLGPALVYGDLT